MTFFIAMYFFSRLLKSGQLIFFYFHYNRVRNRTRSTIYGKLIINHSLTEKSNAKKITEHKLANLLLNCWLPYFFKIIVQNKYLGKPMELFFDTKNQFKKHIWQFEKINVLYKKLFNIALKVFDEFNQKDVNR